jgi:ABC-2 type transport system permease protein
MLSLVLALAVAGSLGREIRDGTLPAWLGRTPWPAIAGKVAPYILLFSLYGALGIGYPAWLRGDGVAGSVLLLLLAQPLFYLATAAYVVLRRRHPRHGYRAVRGRPQHRHRVAFSSATFPVLDGPVHPHLASAAAASAYISCRPSSSSSVRRCRFRCGRWPRCC